MAPGKGCALLILGATVLWSGVLARQFPSSGVKPKPEGLSDTGRYRPGLTPDAQLANSKPDVSFSLGKNQLQPSDIALVMKLNQGNAKYQQQGCEQITKMVPFVNRRELHVDIPVVAPAEVSDPPKESAETREGEEPTNSEQEGEHVKITESELATPPQMFAQKSAEEESRSMGLWTDPAQIEVIQGAVLDSEVPGLAIDAMNSYADDLDLQVSCTKMLTSVAAWNKDAAETLGKMGAVKAVVKAVDTFKEEDSMRKLIGSISHFNDLNDANREQMQHLGVVGLLYDLKQANPADPALELNMQRLLSTLCLHPYAMKEMLDHSYIRTALKAMQDFSEVPGHRGEVMETFRNCFMFQPFAQNTLLENGIIPEIVSAFGSPRSMEKFDLLGAVRLQYNALKIMSELAEDHPNVRDQFIGKGVLKGLSQTLSDDDVPKNFLDYDMLKASCQALINLYGLKPSPWAVPGSGSTAMAMNFDQEKRRSLQASGVMDVLLKKVALRTKDTDLQDSCRPLLHVWF